MNQSSQMNQSPTPQKQVMVVVPTKSIPLSLVLTFFFGPLGMLYSTIAGAIIMFIVELVVGIFTLGLGLFLTHPICMIWGAIAAHNYNKKILGQHIQ